MEGCGGELCFPAFGSPIFLSPSLIRLERGGGGGEVRKVVPHLVVSPRGIYSRIRNRFNIYPAYI